jgi:opacity protein-like surface antigen
MKNILAPLFLLTSIISGTLNGDFDEYCCKPQDYSFYIKVGSGVSFSESAHVTAPTPTWNQAIQGYNSKLGNRAIGALSVGCELMHFIDVDVSISTRSTFKYRKFQTPVDGGGSYTREFDLDVIPILFSVNLLGYDIPCLNWDFACGKVYPIIGAGIGFSNLLITNFRTTGLPPSGGSSPFESFSAENQYTNRKNFTYIALLGLEYNYNDCWAISTGYRWFDAGKFKGPRFQRVSTGAAVDVGGEEWKMRFKSHEWFVEFKIFI